MKKIFIILLSVFTLVSCSSLENENEAIKKSENVKICDSTNSLEQCEVSVDLDIKDDMQKENEVVKIDWDENIEFAYCDNILKYGEFSGYGTRKDYYEKDDVLLLDTKKSEYNESLEDNYFPLSVGEYCKTSDSSKYIFTAHDKRPDVLGMYDKDLDIIEPAIFKHNIFDEIHTWTRTGRRNYGDTSLEKYYLDYREDKSLQSGFGKKDGNTVEYINYGVSLIGHAEIGLRFGPKFLNDWNLDYCTRGLTPAGKLSVCFADVYYKYDLSNNTLYEDKVCSYYIDDNGVINTLQKCFQNTWENKGYNFVTGTDGIKIYQDKIEELSIIDIDLEKSGISFGGVTQTDTKYLDYRNGLGYINKRFRGELKTYNLSEEKEGSNFDNFKRLSLEKSFGEYNSIKFGDERETVFAVVNGQFFNAKKDNTTLSFPVKSYGKILNSYVDNDKQKRTIIIDKSGNIKVIDGYKSEYLNNPDNREVLVGINPSEDFQKDSSVGRTYMGIIDENRAVFFIAESKTQDEIKQIAINYGVNEDNLVMLDGGPSSQFAYFDIFRPGGGINKVHEGWDVPHYIMIYKK